MFKKHKYNKRIIQIETLIRKRKKLPFVLQKVEVVRNIKHICET